MSCLLLLLVGGATETQDISVVPGEWTSTRANAQLIPPDSLYDLRWLDSHLSQYHSFCYQLTIASVINFLVLMWAYFFKCGFSPRCLQINDRYISLIRIRLHCFSFSFCFYCILLQMWDFYLIVAYFANYICFRIIHKFSFCLLQHSMYDVFYIKASCLLCSN
jgi:hypothetical protein